LIPALAAAGVSALKIEGRQRSRSYIESVVREFRMAVDQNASGKKISTRMLAGLTEGQRTTQGAYQKSWR
jgi:collagenase-like PrtC family protease